MQVLNLKSEKRRKSDMQAQVLCVVGNSGEIIELVSDFYILLLIRIVCATVLTNVYKKQEVHATISD